MDKIKETVATFDKYASQYQEKYEAYEPYLVTYEAFSRFIRKEHVRLLDVACGPGNFSSFLLDRKPGLDITGIDLSPAMIELARKKIPGAKFSVMDCRDVSTLGENYDLILIAFCVPYLSREEIVKLIEDTAEMLNPRGLLYLSTMEGDYGKSGIQTSADGDRTYTYFYEQHFLNELLVTNGFGVIHFEKKPFSKGDGSTVTDLFIFAQAGQEDITDE